MLTVVALLLLAIVALLSIPLSLKFDLNSDRGSHNSVELVWLFGLVRTQVPLRQAKLQSSDTDDADDSIEDSNTDNMSAFKVILNKTFRQRILRFISDVWHSIEKNNVEINVKAGLDDPADTGCLWAVIGPIAGYLNTLRQLSVSIEPNFVHAELALNSSGSVRFRPLKVILISIGLLLSPPFWQGVRRMQAAE